MRSSIGFACGGLLFFCAAFVACSSSDGGAGPAAGDAGADGAVLPQGDAASSADAGVDAADQDPNVYPAMHQPIPQVDNLGGPTIAHPRLVAVTFAGDADRDQLRAFTHGIGTSAWWHATLTQYGIADATSGVDAELPDTLSGKTTTDAELQTFLAQQMLGGNLPAPDGQTLYLVFLPKRARLTSGTATSCTDFGGYHSSFPARGVALDGGAPDAATMDAGGDGGAGLADALYAPLADCGGGLPERTITAAHEIAETVTDPYFSSATGWELVSNDAWIPAGLRFGAYSSVSYGEIGDLCEGFVTTDSGFTVPRIWSNAAARASKDPCQPTMSPYFGAAVRTTPRIAGGKKVDGHVAVKRGESIDVVADFFSEAALPSDVTLSVGVLDERGAFAALKALPPGVTVKLSRTKVHNGNAVVLTIAAASTAAPASVSLSVRSSLSTGDFRDWPVVLNVL